MMSINGLKYEILTYIAFSLQLRAPHSWELKLIIHKLLGFKKAAPFE